MQTIVSCVLNEHNILLVMVAVVVCLFGAPVTLQLLRRAVLASGRQRLGWQFLSGVAGGGCVWTTHFVAMLAYEPSVPVSFDPALTVLSLLVAIVGLMASFSICGIGKASIFPILGGVFVGLSFAAMHYLGMFAYQVVGLVNWDMSFVEASIAFSTICSAAVMWLIWQRRFSRQRFWGAVSLLVLGIVGLHFSGMTAFRVTPMAQNYYDMDSTAVMALALAVAIVALIIVGTGLASYLIDSDMRNHSDNHVRHIAAHDALTGLPNRAKFNSHLLNVLDAVEESGRKFAIVALDLNRFKEINDTYGHKAGDAALLILAERMRGILSGDEFIARLGGDEFAAVKTYADRLELDAFAERISAAVCRPMRIDNMDLSVGVSIGVALWPDDAENLDELVNNADLAMYHSKHSFSENICYYNGEIGLNVRKRRQLAEALRMALESDQLELYYQVQKSLSTGEVHGYEALLRWTHPELGTVGPSEFIPIAEENGLIVPLGLWVLRRACQDAARWRNSCRIAVNVSAVQFMDANLPRHVLDVLSETGLEPHRLELELTETAVIKDRVRSLEIMKAIKELGVGVALDDFGSGYSSLETLRAYPFDKIKIDKSFVEDISEDQQSKAIVRAVLALGKSMQIPILAEGIETADQMSILRTEGCDEGQGFLLGRPSPLDELDSQVGLDVEGGPEERDISRGGLSLVVDSESFSQLSQKRNAG